MPLGKGIESGVHNPNGYTLNYNGKIIKHLSPIFVIFLFFSTSKFYLINVFIFLEYIVYDTNQVCV